MKLYKRNAQGKVLEWEIYKKDDKIICNYGLFGKVPHTEILNPKRVKANEIESRIKAKRKEGYKEAIELKDNAPMEIAKSSLASFLDMYLPKNNTTQDGFVLPMLAKVLKDNKPFTKADYIGQYKINGLRCIIGAIKSTDMFKPVKLTYHSREGAEWKQLSWMDDVILPYIGTQLLNMMIEEGACLDGELYLPGYQVNDINSFVKNPSLPQHYKLQYWCYDICCENMNNAIRDQIRFSQINRLSYQFDTINSHLNNKSQLVVVPNVVINSIDSATSYRDKFINLGFEGLIVRNVYAEYQFGKRNSAMFKYKRIDDGKFPIIDIIPEGIRKDLCKLVLKNDINEESFECTLNAPHECQEKILKEKDNYIGLYYAIVEFRERSGVKQVPFHAKAIAIKHK
jgi:ATP-dependent DNA ligase